MKIISMILMMLIAVSAFSQQKEIAQKEIASKDRVEKADKMKMSAQEKATFASKRMALELDLTEAQRLEVEKLHLQRFQEREGIMKERQKLRKKNFAKRISRVNEKLDKQLAHNEKMKSILTEEQYNQWKKSQQKPAKKKIAMKKKKV